MLFFFYGTLLDRDLRTSLAGTKAARLRTTPGTLLNYRRRRARFGNYPVLVPDLRGQVRGVFVEGLDAELLLWVAHYEGPGYLPGRVTAIDRAGQRLRPWAFLPITRHHAGDRPWDLLLWQRTAKRRVYRQLQHWLLPVDDGRPLALDAPWRVRRRLAEIQHQGHDQPRPNPQMRDRRDAVCETESWLAAAAA